MPEDVQTIDFVAPESLPATSLCEARIAIPEAGAWPRCQLPSGHDAWHRHIDALSGIEGEVEYRWS